MSRIRTDGVAGRLTAALGFGATTMYADDLGALDVVTGGDTAAITLFKVNGFGRLLAVETISVTAHAEDGVSATVLRAQEGTTEHLWPVNSHWVHGPTALDWSSIWTSVTTETARALAAEALLIPLAQKAAANGVATLGADAKIPAAQLPALALGETFQGVASQAAMLALDAQRGDLAIRTDLDPDGVFWLAADAPAVLGNWIRIGAVDLTVDGAAGVPSLRTLGAGAAQAAAGDDVRLSDTRVPTNLSVTTGKIADGAVTAAKVAADVATQAELDGAITGLSATYAKVSGVSLDHKLGANGDEPGSFVVWAADDGYDTQAAYFAALAAAGIRGTLFLSPDFVNKAGNSPTFGDAYITSAQVAALVAAGHELGSHGKNHEDLVGYRLANGDAALDALLGQAITAIEAFGVTVRTGSFPGGTTDSRTREIVARRHLYFRTSEGTVSRNALNPYKVPGIDILAPSEATIKTYIDQAVANRSVVVLFLHGTITGAVLTKVNNVIAYANSLGVPQGTFYEAMNQRMQWRSLQAMIDAQGNAFHPVVRTNRLEVARNDHLSDYWFADIDEVSNAPYIDAPGGQPFEFRTTLRLLGASGLQVGRRRVYADGSITNGSPTLTSAAAGFQAGETGTVTGTGIPGGTTYTYLSPTTATMSANATATATGVTITLGRTAVQATFGGVDVYGPMLLYGAASPAVEFRLLESTSQGQISAPNWSRAGSGGGMVIDSGTGGSHIDAKGFGFRVVSYVDSSVQFQVGTTGIGFFGGAKAAKQTVTGSRGGNAALASLLTALAAHSLITDSSSA